MHATRKSARGQSIATIGFVSIALVISAGRNALSLAIGTPRREPLIIDEVEHVFRLRCIRGQD